MTPTAEENGRLLTLAEQVAREAGALALSLRRSAAVEVAGTKSSPTDVVTEADVAVERLVRGAVAAARPYDAVVGEEGDDRAGSSGLTWVVDPIDGTVNYLYDIPRWSTSIAVEDAEGALVAVVHAPAAGETFTAVRGVGAWRDGRSVRPSGCTDLSAALLGTGFGYRAERRARQAEVVAAVLPRIRDVRRAGAASLDLCDVACGRLDGFYEQGLQPWDLAAGRLVVEQAGGLVSGLGGRPPGEPLTVAAGVGLHPLLVDLLTTLEADRPS
jgi:fructose-1,6-bisphosphatase/inositol monophosphatase family enzyme